MAFKALDKLQINNTDVLTFDGTNIILSNVLVDDGVEISINSDNLTEGTTNRFFTPARETVLTNADIALDGRLDTLEGAGTGSVAKALVDAKNNAEAMIHASEKSVKDLGDKADKAEVEKVNDAIKDLQEELKTDDAEKITEKTMKLTEAAGKIAEQAYKEEAAKQQGAETTEGETKSDDNVVDADFTEVKEEEEKEEEPKAENK